MRILWASPLPPVRSGVADYAVELLPALQRHADVRVVAPPDGSGPGAGTSLAGCPVVPTSEVPMDHEIQVIHLGNNPHHRWLIDRLAMPRTSVVLHDAVLHHLLVESSLAVGNERRFEGYLLDAHPDAEALVAARRFGVTGRRDPFLFPARRAFLQGVESVVVHSAWAAEAVSRDLPELPVAVVNLTVADPGAVDRAALRERLGVRPDEVLMMHLGYLTPDKGLHDVLSGLSVARRMGGAARLMIVGEGEEHTVLHDAVDSLGLTPWVRFSGWVEPEEFCMLPAAADLGVVLRSPSAGETSAAVLRFLACGTPVAVTGLHQFLEWPEMAAPRITPGRSAGPDLARLLLDVADTDSWRRRRREARATYQGGHTPEIAARQLVEALRRTTAGR